MERKIGLFSVRAFVKASSPHGSQSTGLSACWRRYGDFSFARRLGIAQPTALPRKAKLQRRRSVAVRTRRPHAFYGDRAPSLQQNRRVNLDTTHLILLLAGVTLAAFLYSSVGHAGASGYIAVMTLCGLTAIFIRPTALVLNILVAAIGSFQFWRAGYFSWRLFWPFALLSIPAAYLGGYLPVPAAILKVVIGIVLLFSAARLFFRQGDPRDVAAPAIPAAVAMGAGIGFLSGLTGTGGGIFLTPLLLFCHWATMRGAAAVSALFILVNSIAGLVGFISSGRPVPQFAWLLAVAAVIAGTLGSYFGSRRFPVRTISIILATVLVLAGCKLIFT